MNIISILFYKKFDYVVFPIGLITFLIMIIDLFDTTKLDASLVWGQLLFVFAYYCATRGRAERVFMANGIEPVVVLSLFGFLVILSFLASVIVLMDLK